MRGPAGKEEVLRVRILRACIPDHDDDLDRLVGEYGSLTMGFLDTAEALVREGLLFDWHTTHAGRRVVLGDDA